MEQVSSKSTKSKVLSFILLYSVCLFKVESH